MKSAFLLTAAILFFYAASIGSAPALAASSCTKVAYFKALVSEDHALKKGSIHTFSKTNAGDFWFWQEKRTLINPAITPEPTSTACKNPGLIINRWLTMKDMVKTEDEIRGSSFLVTEDWGAKAVFYAMMNGETIRVVKP